MIQFHKGIISGSDKYLNFKLTINQYLKLDSRCRNLQDLMHYVLHKRHVIKNAPYKIEFYNDYTQNGFVIIGTNKNKMLKLSRVLLDWIGSGSPLKFYENNTIVSDIDSWTK